MKKMISFLLVSALLFSATALAEGEKTETLAGVVIQMDEKGFLMEDDLWGEVRVNTDNTTVFEGEETLQKGDYVTVFFSGAMTMSLPPQIFATKIICEKLEGKVTAISEDGKNIMVDTQQQGSVIVYLPQDAIRIPTVGSHVILYYNGIMTMSLPPQINAQAIENYAAIEGEVEETEEDSFLIKQENDVRIKVNLGEESLVLGEIKAGEKVQVLYDGRMLRSIPAQVFGIRIKVENTQTE